MGHIGRSLNCLRDSKINTITLDLKLNNLGVNETDIKYFGERMHSYTNHSVLEHFHLDLSYNSLGLNADNMKYLG